MAQQPPSGVSPDVVQLIIILLVVFGSAIATLLRRLDRWIQEHRFPPGERPAGAASRPSVPEPAPKPTVEEEEAEEPATVLMRELERALLDRERPHPAPPRAEPPPIAPLPGHLAPRPSDEVVLARRAAVVRAVDEAAAPLPSVRPQPAAAPPTAVYGAASVSRHRYGHLAQLHSPADLRKAIVLTEILGPPACYRRLGWRFPR